MAAPKVTDELVKEGETKVEIAGMSAGMFTLVAVGTIAAIIIAVKLINKK